MIWIFWVCWASPAWYNVDCSQFMSQLDHCQFQLVHLTMSIVQWEISSMKLRKPLLTFSHSIFSIHCANLFLHFSCIFTFLEIIKHNMLKMLHIFFHLQYQWLYKKFTNFDVFLKCMLIWQLSQYNLTKLLWMKLKITQRY